MPTIECIYLDNERRLRQFLQLRLGSGDEAQDAAQQTFLRLWQRRDQLSNENLEALLFVTARNIAIDIIRRRRHAPGLETKYDDGEEAAAVVDSRPLPDRDVSARQNLALVLKLVDELPERCRRAFVEYKFYDKSYAEIAQDMGVTESMIRKYVIKAVTHCAGRFEEQDGWE